jgi:hypothetical protein
MEIEPHSTIRVPDVALPDSVNLPERAAVVLEVIAMLRIEESQPLILTGTSAASHGESFVVVQLGWSLLDSRRRLHDDAPPIAVAGKKLHVMLELVTN